MTRAVVLALAVVAACGRIGFEPPGTDDVPDAALDDGLLLWMRFEPGAVVRDEVTGTDAACDACPGTVGNGAIGRAGSFDAPTCARWPAERFGAPVVTVATWVRLPDDERCGTLVGKPLDSESRVLNSFELWQCDGVQAQFHTVPNHADEEDQTVPLTPTGTWHHLAGTFDATAKRTYLDGELVLELPGPFAALEYDSEDDVRVGCDVDEGIEGQYLRGDLDELRIYDRALDADEIAALATP